MRAAAAALLAFAIALVIAVPTEAATRRQVQAAAFAVPTPTSPPRDVVIEQPSRAAARAVASATVARFPVNDGAGGSVDITKSTVCSISCTDANEQVIANFLGSLVHRDEINLLTVHLVDPTEIGLPQNCGSPSAQACYYPSFDRMVINGNDTTAPDGATRDFVIAHEYGHHLANHRNNSPFDNPAIDWGPRYWTSYERVCQGVRAGVYFPGDEADHYFENPGEAFAESFAFNRFPTAPVPWAWIASLQPDPNSFAAIQRDALDPWTGADTDKRKGRFPNRRRPRKKLKQIATPQDGDLTLKLAGPDRADLALKLKGPDGRILERSDGVGSQEEVSYTICGEKSVTAVVRRRGRRLTRFKLTALRP